MSAMQDVEALLDIQVNALIEILSQNFPPEKKEHLTKDVVLKTFDDLNSISPPKMVVTDEMKFDCFKSLLALHLMKKTASTKEELQYADGQRGKYLNAVEEFLKDLEKYSNQKQKPTLVDMFQCLQEMAVTASNDEERDNVLEKGRLFLDIVSKSSQEEVENLGKYL